MTDVLFSGVVLFADGCRLLIPVTQTQVWAVPLEENSSNLNAR
jgi:hypothetical protein